MTMIAMMMMVLMMVWWKEWSMIKCVCPLLPELAVLLSNIIQPITRRCLLLHLIFKTDKSWVYTVIWVGVLTTATAWEHNTPAYPSTYSRVHGSGLSTCVCL